MLANECSEREEIELHKRFTEEYWEFLEKFGPGTNHMLLSRDAVIDLAHVIQWPDLQADIEDKGATAFVGWKLSGWLPPVGSVDFRDGYVGFARTT